MRQVFHLRLLLLLIAGWLFSAPEVWARVWTDHQGQTIEAKFVRVFGANVVLQLPTGRVVKAPLANFSEADQAYIRDQLHEAGIRVWTDQQGRQIQARFLRVRDDEVFLSVNGKTMPVPFLTLSVADRRFVRKQAEERNQSDSLPPAAQDDPLLEERTWTDSQGVALQGQFDRLLADGRVLLAIEGETRVVSIKELSSDDHDYLRENVTDAALARLIPAPPAPEPVIVAQAPPVPSPSPAPPRPSNMTPPPNPFHHAPMVLPPREISPPAYVPPASRDYYTPPTPQPTTTIELRCDVCGAKAPPGAKFGEPCTFCNKPQSSAYEMGRTFGIYVPKAGFAGLIGLFLGWLWRRFNS